MRVILWLSAALTALYCGYWVVGSRAVLSGAKTALMQMQADRKGDFAGISLHGFPSRFDITVDQPRLVSPDGLTEWSAPFIQVMALSYHPNQIIAVWPHEQTVATGNQTLTLTTSDMRASALFGAKVSLPLDHSTLVALDGKLSSDIGWTATFDRLQLSSRQAEGSALNHEIYAALTGLDVIGVPLPESFETGVQGSADVDADLTFDRPPAMNAQPANLKAVDIGVFRVRWGGVELDAKGRLEVAASGTPQGRIMLSLTGWQKLLDLAVSTGSIRPELAPTYANMLTQLSETSSEPGRLELPLVFNDGQMSLGPLPLGPAPRLAAYSQ